MRGVLHHSARKRGLSILEVLVALGILTAGMLSIMAIFPYTLKAQLESELLCQAAGLAQMKVEEIRRDDTLLSHHSGTDPGNMVLAIQALTLATETAPIPFSSEPRLTYSYCGETVIYKDLDPADPRAASLQQTNVARVIIRYAPSFRASQDAIYELRFQ